MIVLNLSFKNKMGRSIIRKDIVRSIFREIKIEAKSEQEKMALLEMVNI